VQSVCVAPEHDRRIATVKAISSHVTPTVFKDFSVKRKDSGNIQLLSDQLSFTQTLVLGHTARFSTTLPIIYLKKRLET
jgi:hypothetical protein